MKEIPQEFLLELQKALNTIAELGALQVEVKLYAPMPPQAPWGHAPALPSLAWDFYVEGEEGPIRYAHQARYASDPLSWILAACALLGDLALVIAPMIPGDYEFRCLVHQVMMDDILRYAREQLTKRGIFPHE